MRTHRPGETRNTCNGCEHNEIERVTRHHSRLPLVALALLPVCIRLELSTCPRWRDDEAEVRRAQVATREIGPGAWEALVTDAPGGIPGHPGGCVFGGRGATEVEAVAAARAGRETEEARRLVSARHEVAVGLAQLAETDRRLLAASAGV